MRFRTIFTAKNLYLQSIDLLLPCFLALASPLLPDTAQTFDQNAARIGRKQTKDKEYKHGNWYR
jgi:hypothetical protein